MITTDEGRHENGGSDTNVVLLLCFHLFLILYTLLNNVGP